MNFSEKDMEDCIWDNPSNLIGEEGLVPIERQVNLDGFRADLLLGDSNGGHLLVEIQKGGLDRTHIWKILDYGFRLTPIFAVPGLLVFSFNAASSMAQCLVSKGFDNCHIIGNGIQRYLWRRIILILQNIKHATIFTSSPCKENMNYLKPLFIKIL